MGRMVGCAYFSSMLILLSQTAHSPQNPSVERDSTLTEAALKLMEDLVEREGIEAMRKTLEMSQELNNVGSWKRLLVNGLSEDLEPAFMQGFLH